MNSTQTWGTSQARWRQLRASSGGSSDATSKASFPLHNTEARQHQRNFDVTADVILSCCCCCCCCCPSAGAEDWEQEKRPASRRLGLSTGFGRFFCFATAYASTASFFGNTLFWCQRGAAETLWLAPARSLGSFICCCFLACVYSARGHKSNHGFLSIFLFFGGIKGKGGWRGEGKGLEEKRICKNDQNLHAVLK